MKTCVIFGAAGFDGLLTPIPADALTVAADGGLKHTDALGLDPEVILGDFDSLGYIPADSRVFPVEKDDTDAMLAVRLGLERGCEEFFLYGGMDGPRLDHTVANFQTLAFLTRRGGRGWLIGRDHIVTVMEGETLHFGPEAEGVISVFCLGADSGGVTLRGLKYPLENGSLTADFPLGVSNHFTGQPASLSVRQGMLLVIWDRAVGLPRRERLC